MLSHDARLRDGAATALEDSTSVLHVAITPEEEVAVEVAPTVLDVSRYRHSLSYSYDTSLWHLTSSREVTDSMAR